ncbi:MAG: aminopeptidase P family N-terminal domain-containing protein, partial [Proteobacteria bacterium]|nr:aminopeptidase P family N-terminal domain-containing protein [Pseudomonadota bacterium]
MELPRFEHHTRPYLGQYELLPPPEIRTRLAKLQTELRRADLDGALITERIDLFYFSGTAQDGWLWVSAEGEPRLRIRRDLERARAESPLGDVSGLNGFKDLPGIMPPGVRRVGLELDVLPANLYLTLAELLAGLELSDVSLPIKTIRMIKSDYELTWMRRAAALNDAMFGWMGDQLRGGMREIEIEAAAAYFLRSQG